MTVWSGVFCLRTPFTMIVYTHTWRSKLRVRNEAWNLQTPHPRPFSSGPGTQRRPSVRVCQGLVSRSFPKHAPIGIFSFNWARLEKSNLNERSHYARYWFRLKPWTLVWEPALPALVATSLPPELLACKFNLLRIWGLWLQPGRFCVAKKSINFAFLHEDLWTMPDVKLETAWPLQNLIKVYSQLHGRGPGNTIPDPKTLV